MGTQCQLDIGKTDGFVSVPEIIGEHQLVLIDIHRVHENIDDALSVSHVLHIANRRRYDIQYTHIGCKYN